MPTRPDGKTLTIKLFGPSEEWRQDGRLRARRRRAIPPYSSNQLIRSPSDPQRFWTIPRMHQPTMQPEMQIKAEPLLVALSRFMLKSMS